MKGMNAGRAMPPTVREDAGIAIPLVLFTMVLVTLMASLVVATAARTSPKARSDQDAKTAVAAARAGIDEVASMLTAYNGDAAKVVQSSTRDGAYDSDPSTPPCESPGKKLPGEGTVARYCYRLLVSPESVAASGQSVIEVTGIAGLSEREVSRTMQATLRRNQGGAATHALFTNYTTMDPTLPVLIPFVARYHKNYLTVQQQHDCVRYRWQRPSRATPYVPEYALCEPTLEDPVAWTPWDKVSGSIHSNDTYTFNWGSPQFTGPKVTSGAPESSPEPLFHGYLATDSIPVGVSRGELVSPLPVSTAKYRGMVSPDPDSGALVEGRPGCAYKGITKITVRGNKMVVESPNTTIFGEGCPDSATIYKDIPNLIYVQATEGTCTGIDGYPDIDMRRGWQEAGTSDRAGTATINYEPCQALALVGGSITGASTTIVSAHDIMVVDNITVTDRSGTDMVGLVAQRNVWVHNPVNCQNYLESRHPCQVSLRVYPDIVTNIDAAITAVSGSFLVQNYMWGNNWRGWTQPSAPLGCRVLTVNGAISANYLGPTSEHRPDGNGCERGYYKNYNYDSRMKIMQPPYYNLDTSTVWEVAQLTDAPSTAG